MIRRADVVVVGGGAAGLMAAGSAAETGARVLLLERMPQPGRKLAITGKGRCNLTNTLARPAFETHFDAAADWLKPAFNSYFSDDLMRFLKAQGLALVTERGGRVFLANGKAPDVVKALVAWVRGMGVHLETRCRVTSLTVEDEVVTGVQLGKARVDAGAVVLACGGASYPGTGSSGDGYVLAGNTGHRLVQPLPALVPLTSRPKPVRELMGLGLKNVKVSLVVGGHCQREAFGEMGFSENGVNGPVVLTLSGTAVEALHRRLPVQLEVDLKPALSPEKLEARLQRDLAARGDEPMRSVLRGLLPRGLVALCLARCGIQGQCRGKQVTPAARERLVDWIKHMEIEICGDEGMHAAIVTAGGVDLQDVNPDTMASRRLAGLYIAGELLDVQGDTGGFNLQAAFSTGVLAGRCAGRFVKTGRQVSPG